MSKERAFTLMEMMVVLSIFTVVMGIAYTAISLNETYRDLVLTKIQLYRQNKRAVDSLSAELQRSQSSRVTIIDNASPIPDEIRFQIPLPSLIDGSYNIPWGARQDSTDYLNNFIHYRVNGTNLVREVVDGNGNPVGGTRQETIAENITRLQFTDLFLEGLIAAFGTQQGDPDWDPRFDLNNDGRVAIDDIALYMQVLRPTYIKINIGSQRRMIRGWTIRSDLELTVFLRN